jgi:hypothetical protein
MDYEISVSENKRHIIIKISSPMTAELGRRCGVQAADIAKQNNIDRYLFDLRGAPNVDTVQSNYQFAYNDLADFGFPRGSRSALLTDAGDESHNFLETLFLNAGYIVKVFSDPDHAVAWLEK